MSNKESKNPAEGEARIAKIKEGRTRLAHKAEHGVGLHTGTVVAMTARRGLAARCGHTTFLGTPQDFEYKTRD